MAKRKPAPTEAEIYAAIARAKKGKGRALADMIKSFSAEDLARGFAAAGRYGGYGWDTWFSLSICLNYAAGRKSERERCNGVIRDIRKRGRAERRAAEAEL